jgi:hypothetical protein
LAEIMSLTIAARSSCGSAAAFRADHAEGAGTLFASPAGTQVIG